MQIRAFNTFFYRILSKKNHTHKYISMKLTIFKRYNFNFDLGLKKSKSKHESYQKCDKGISCIRQISKDDA